jgi:putative endonuclease
MFYVYILLSEKDGNLYVGYTPDLKKRFEKHNNGYVIATKYRA